MRNLLWASGAGVATDRPMRRADLEGNREPYGETVHLHRDHDSQDHLRRGCKRMHAKHAPYPPTLSMPPPSDRCGVATDRPMRRADLGNREPYGETVHLHIAITTLRTI